MTRPDHSMTLQEIYQWFRDNTNKARKSFKGWQNSIRHNLSMNKVRCISPYRSPGSCLAGLVEVHANTYCFICRPSPTEILPVSKARSARLSGCSRTGRSVLGVYRALPDIAKAIHLVEPWAAGKPSNHQHLDSGSGQTTMASSTNGIQSKAACFCHVPRRL
jgi:hypothetical protein